MLKKLTDKLLKEISYQTGWQTVSPEFLSILLTMRCNFRCQSCSIWKKKNHNELGKDDWEKIISKLPQLLKPNAFVEINCGEPLIKKGLALFVIQELKKYFHKVALNSNGLLIGKKSLNQLMQAGLDTIKISFYSLDEKTHNDLRGNNLAYIRAKEAIQCINAKKIPLEVGILITAKNINGLPDLIRHLQTLPNTSIILQPLDEKIENQEAKN